MHELISWLYSFLLLTGLFSLVHLLCTQDELKYGIMHRDQSRVQAFFSRWLFLAMGWGLWWLLCSLPLMCGDGSSDWDACVRSRTNVC